MGSRSRLPRANGGCTRAAHHLAASWRSGDAAACKAVYAGSIPAEASTRAPRSGALFGLTGRGPSGGAGSRPGGGRRLGLRFAGPPKLPALVRC